MLECLMKLVQDDEGQALVEYGLIIALIAVAVIVTVGLLGKQIKEAFLDITSKLTSEGGLSSS